MLEHQRLHGRWWPDFLIVPPGPNESIFAVELKSGSDPLRSAQEPLHAALRRAGLPVDRITEVSLEISPLMFT